MLTMIVVPRTVQSAVPWAQSTLVSIRPSINSIIVVLVVRKGDFRHRSCGHPIQPVAGHFCQHTGNVAEPASQADCTVAALV